MNLDEARRVARSALQGRPIAVDPGYVDAIVEQYARELVSGREPVPSQNRAYRIPMRAGAGGQRSSGAGSSTAGAPDYGLGSPPRAASHPRDVTRDVTRSDGLSDVKVTLTEQAAQQIYEYATARGGYTEEGGLLIGVRDVRRMLITDVSGPGSDAERTAEHYRPDAAHDMAYLKQIEQELGGATVEVGGWHLHTGGGAPRASDADLQFWANGLTIIDSQPAYVGLIVSIQPRSFRDQYGAHSWRPPALRSAAFIVGEAGRISGEPWYRCQPANLEVQGSPSSWLA